jgi:acyl transferase domain-containing protein
LSKVLSAFENHTIPPNVNLKVPNPKIRWGDFRMRVPLEPTHLSTQNGKSAVVALASSGIGGSNFHAVIEGPPVDESSVIKPGQGLHELSLFVAGGLSPRSVAAAADALRAQIISQTDDWQVLSTILGRQSRQMTWRSFAVAHKHEDISQITFSQGVLVPRFANRAIFVFSGQGPQYADSKSLSNTSSAMDNWTYLVGRQLFQAYPAFRDSILECDMAYQEMTGKSIIHDVGLFGSQSALVTDTWPVSLTLPSLCIFQIAMFDLLMSIGVVPAAVIGHSAGDTPVLYASGAAPKSMAVKLAVARGIALSSMEGFGGTMAAASCSALAIQDILEAVNGDLNMESTFSVEIACYNAPGAVAIAGPADRIDEVIKLAAERQIVVRKIRTRVPVHSLMMEECRTIYQDLVHEVFSGYPGTHRPIVPVFSASTGKFFGGDFTEDYFWISARQPVEFVNALQAIKQELQDIMFIEVSPHPVLSSYITETLSASYLTVPAARRPAKDLKKVEHRVFLQMIGTLLTIGWNGVDFSSLNNCHGSSIPPRFAPQMDYPFQRKSFPLYTNPEIVKKQREVKNGPLNSAYLRINSQTHPSLADHVIRGEAIMPAAGFIESVCSLDSVGRVQGLNVFRPLSTRLLSSLTLACGRYYH